MFYTMRPYVVRTMKIKIKSIQCNKSFILTFIE